MRRNSSPAAVLAGLCIALWPVAAGHSQAAAAPTRDVAGITIRMPLAEALQRLTEYGKGRPTWNVGQEKVTFAQTAYVTTVRADGVSKEVNESITLEFAPAPPPAEPIVTAMYREVLYGGGQERTVDVVVKSLKDRYGPSPRLAESNGYPIMWWFFEGKGVPSLEKCNVAPRDYLGAPAEVFEPSRSGLTMDKLAALAAGCGSYATIRMEPMPPSLVGGVEIAVRDAPLQLERSKAMMAYLTNAANAAQSQKESDAAKRTGP